MQTTIPVELAVLVAVAVPLLSALMTVGGVVYSQWVTNRREAQRLAHERETKRMELEEKKLERLRKERLAAYIELAEETAMVDTNEFFFEDLKAAFSKIELMASSKPLLEAWSSMTPLLGRERRQETSN